MKAPAPSRRDFLSTTSLVAVGLATGGAMLLAPDFAWALSTKAIDAHAAQTLLVMARQLFPHERLGDQYYAAVVEAVDKRAASDSAVHKLVTDGVAQLDAARGIAFVAPAILTPRCLCGYARLSAERPCTGQARRFASRSMSFVGAASTAILRAPICSTGRSRWRSLSRFTR